MSEPFTETHRKTLVRALDVGTSAWEPFELTTAIRAALAEIDRLTALDRLGHPRDFFDSVPGRELVAAYQAAYPGRTVIDVDVLRWLNTMREAATMTKAQYAAALAEIDRLQKERDTLANYLRGMRSYLRVHHVEWGDDVEQALQEVR